MERPKSPGFVTFKDQFQNFSNFPGGKNTQDAIQFRWAVHWLKQSKIMSKHDVTPMDCAKAFNKIASSNEVNLSQFHNFLEELADSRNLNVGDMKRQLTRCGSPNPRDAQQGDLNKLLRSVNWQSARKTRKDVYEEVEEDMKHERANAKNNDKGDGKERVECKESSIVSKNEKDTKQKNDTKNVENTESKNRNDEEGAMLNKVKFDHLDLGKDMSEEGALLKDVRFDDLDLGKGMSEGGSINTDDVCSITDSEHIEREAFEDTASLCEETASLCKEEHTCSEIPDEEFQGSQTSTLA